MELVFGERIWILIVSPLATLPVLPVNAQELILYTPPEMEIGMSMLIQLTMMVLDWMLVLSSTLVWFVNVKLFGMSRILNMVRVTSPVFPARSNAVKVNVLSPPLRGMV